MSVCRTGRCLGLAGLLAASMSVYAQQPAGRPAELEAGLARQDEQMRQAGWQVMHMIDFGQTGTLWDQASHTMKRLVAREEFVRQITTERLRLGPVVERGWPEITRSVSDGRDGTPAGLYLSVISNTRFAHQSALVQELVSFRYDEDQVWRITGYSLQ